MNLEFNRQKLGQFCRARGITRLELFGSALRDDFCEGSDVDLLATLRADARPTLLDWADMQEKLAEVFGRSVDLVSRRAIERSRNRYRKQSIPPRHSRSMPRDNAYLEDILQASKAIRRFIAGISLEDFKSNEEKYEAVNRKFSIIGEAARRLSPEALKTFPEMPWKLITAMRNILIHDYDDVDLDFVWEAA
jgi:uncharacterized protein with HEPN domain/predicted nucleotidyltransferase